MDWNDYFEHDYDEYYTPATTDWGGYFEEEMIPGFSGHESFEVLNPIVEDEHGMHFEMHEPPLVPGYVWCDKIGDVTSSYTAQDGKITCYQCRLPVEDGE